MNKLYRSARDKKITGLIGGLAQYMNIDVTLLRVLFLISIPFTGGTTLFIYIIASLVVPKEPVGPFDPYGNGMNGYGGYGYNGGSQQGPFDPYGNRYANPDLHKYGPSSYGTNPNPNASVNLNKNTSASPIDSMMEDIEKKALKKELEELRAKVAQYEKGDK